MQNLINDVSKVIIPHVCNDTFIEFKNKTFILTPISNQDKRMFGGAFVKIAKMGDSFKTTWISSTIDEEEFKEFISIHYNIDKKDLFRFY